MSFDSELFACPNAVVVQLEMRANSLRGLRTLLGVKLAACPAKHAKPAGFLRHDKRVFVGFSAPRLVMRWYWRDAASLDAWTRDVRYVQWWVDLVSNTPGTAIRVETHRVRRAEPAAQDRSMAPRRSAPALL